MKQELALKEKELDAKFRETAAYRNMKNLLEKKNVQIKQFRSQLQTTESKDDYLPEWLSTCDYLPVVIIYL